jgi:hypothetical protein
MGKNIKRVVILTAIISVVVLVILDTVGYVTSRQFWSYWAKNPGSAAIVCIASVCCLLTAVGAYYAGLRLKGRAIIICWFAANILGSALVAFLVVVCLRLAHLVQSVEKGGHIWTPGIRTIALSFVLPFISILLLSVSWWQWTRFWSKERE